jgi:hypothetical protein
VAFERLLLIGCSSPIDPHAQEALVNNRYVLTIAGATFALFVGFCASSASAQISAGKATPLIVGQWKLNAGKSNLRPPPGYLEVRQYQLRPDGFMTGLLVTASAQGYHYLQFTAKSDGKDYPEYSDELMADMIAAGRQTPRTYSEKVIDDYVIEWIDKAAGKVIMQGKKTISKDGKTLTITTDGRPASEARVYDRQ